MQNNISPLISVIMNCYNGEKFLKKSIQSVLKQKYKKWELIFWDNKSNDNSKEIALSFKDKRIKYFKAVKFTKLYEARNLAVSKAKGQFICFIDTDDWWMAKKLSSQVRIIKKNKNIKLVYSNIFIYDNQTKQKKLLSNKKLPSGKITQNLLDDYKLGILSVMIKRNIFKIKKFNKNYNIIGDFDFFLRLSTVEEFFSIQEPLVYYRLHKENYSKKINIYSKELNHWLKKNTIWLKKYKYSLSKINLYNSRLKIKKFLYLGP
tara:strand:- start:191 stop:976 length:786 start_codon:yes stop_codon:yes gene_type:complete